uniref:Alpha/beta hydrolase fold n=1 Tax=Caulobacter sp. (strain K31) TaxID=366602 RepID=B0T6N2_CAUSK
MSDPLPDMPPVRFAPVNGLQMAYYEVARPSNPTLENAIPIVLCHGFPELAFSWRHQLRALETAGRWAIAPDQRGYGLTGGPGEGAPDPVESYDADQLTSDLAALLDTLGAKQAIWCGHDWGAIIAWQMALRQASRTAAVISMNVPFQPHGRTDPIEQLRAHFGEQTYTVEFQTAETPDAVLNADVRRTVSFFMRRDWGGEDVRRGVGEGYAFAAFPFVRMLDQYDPAADERPSILTDEEFGVFVRMFEQTGFTGPINWYRNLSRNWRTSAALARRVDVPALMIMAEFDPVLPPAACDGMERYCGRLEKVLVGESGHWTQQEQPQQTNHFLLDWLDRHFPVPGA